MPVCDPQTGTFKYLMRNCFLILILLIYHSSISQNLVPNPGFSLYTTCPFSQNQLQYAIPWYNPSVWPSTPDFFHQCAGTIPSSGYYYQYDHTGSGGFAGCGTYARSVNFTNPREYIQVQLTNSLVAGSRYCIEYFVNRVESCDMAITDMGAYLSDSAIYLTSNTNFQVIPSIENPDTVLLNDTMNWIRISGIYSAHGGERFLTIGNFRDSLNSHSVLVDSNLHYYYAYYLIDDVSVINCDSLFIGLPEKVLSNTINLYPNPSSDAITITSNQKLLSISILNLLGNLVLENYSNQNKTILSISSLPAGIYFAQITTTNGIAVKKFVKQ